jgi:putative endonuclease
MKTENKAIGWLGEKMAMEYLKTKGYEMVERNFSTRFGEIDLICRENGVLVFVEVKTKKGQEFGLPEEMFTHYKYEKVKRMAVMYLGGREVPCRIDMVAVELDGDNRPRQIKHYQNVILSSEKY